MSESLVVYYDRSCPLCVAEMETLKAADPQSRLTLVDCSAPQFDDPAARSAGVSVDQMLAALHVRDPSGNWYRGVEAFAQIYTLLGIRSIAKWLNYGWLRPWLDRLYPVVARHRQVLSRMGLTRLFAALVGWHARRAVARNCTLQGCDVPPQAASTRSTQEPRE